jgi:CBS domain-containing protein
MVDEIINATEGKMVTLWMECKISCSKLAVRSFYKFRRRFLLSAVIRVSDIMTNKVISVDTSATIFVTVSKMVRSRVGCIVVLEAKEVAGIVTKGDVLKRGTLKGIDPKSTSVKKVMSRKVVTIDKDASVEEASRLMSEKKVSKLPVLEDGKLIGIITSTDIIRTEPMMVGYLHELIKARYVPHELA